MDRTKSIIGMVTATAIAITGCTIPDVKTESLGLSEALRVDTTGYARAVGPRPFSFPEDHGPHDDYRLEWWYFTGNLADQDGERYGYQFTVFRTALTPPDEPSMRSDWRVSQLYSAHLAVANGRDASFSAEERFSRTGPGLAGARVDSSEFRVWVEDWSAWGPSSLESIRIVARQESGETGLRLDLRRAKPIVLQGDEGWSPKGTEPGQASYYYTIPRWTTDGWLYLGPDSVEVSGLSWLDREWSTSLLSESQTGWDWFSLQLDDGHDLMYFQLRDTTKANFVEGSLIGPAGRRIDLDASELTLTVEDYWRSPSSGIEYPSGWILEGPETRLTITPLLTNQELELSIQYWEGAVVVEGMHLGRETLGRGYAELTGYVNESEGRP